MPFQTDPTLQNRQLGKVKSHSLDHWGLGASLAKSRRLAVRLGAIYPEFGPRRGGTLLDAKGSASFDADDRLG